ncbi:MAG: DNA-3-methyladenine glycosylase 2 family protein [Lachnospiraceae bacterium]|nr:DNA-3-methyladenine glycosylase 2 family protein [Lachnospiraceae bacterium]
MIKHIKNMDIEQIAESGQCFRMLMTGEGSAKVIAGGRVLEIKALDKGEFDLDCDEADFNDFWENYFDLSADYSSYINAIDKDDEFLIKAAKYGDGIRILNQEPFETLISFIISQRKNIPAIRSSVEKICRLCGKKINGEDYAFPEPEAIAALSEKELGNCSLGYRVPYIRETAEMIARGDVDLMSLHTLDDEGLYDKLLSFKGVGKKVANCVMLFAYHRIAAFPVDVWIQRIADTYYDGRFPEEKYPGFAGVLQQYMFFYGRTYRE